MFVEDYMTPKPVTVTEDASLSSATDLMRTRRIRHLPVVDGARRLIGIVSDRDVRAATGFDQNLAERLTVGEVMIADPCTISGDATLDEALDVMTRHRYGSLPVVRGEALVGILTRADLLRAFHRMLGLDVPGHRLEVALPHGCADLASAFIALNLPVSDLLSAVVSASRRDGRESSLYLRVPRATAQEAERRLRASTALLLVSEHD